MGENIRPVYLVDAELRVRQTHQVLDVARERYEREIVGPLKRQKIGRCFRYRNRSSGAESWWLYLRIEGVHKGGYWVTTIETDDQKQTGVRRWVHHESGGGTDGRIHADPGAPVPLRVGQGAAPHRTSERQVTPPAACRGGR